MIRLDRKRLHVFLLSRCKQPRGLLTTGSLGLLRQHGAPVLHRRNHARARSLSVHPRRPHRILPPFYPPPFSAGLAPHRPFFFPPPPPKNPRRLSPAGAPRLLRQQVAPIV